MRMLGEPPGKLKGEGGALSKAVTMRAAKGRKKSKDWRKSGSRSKGQSGIRKRITLQADLMKTMSMS